MWLLSLSLSLFLFLSLAYITHTHTHTHTHTQQQAPETSIDKSKTFVRRGGRLNTKLRAQTTVGEAGEEQTLTTFWDRNFPEEDEVQWYKFQQAFLKDYEAQLSGECQL